MKETQVRIGLILMATDKNWEVEIANIQGEIKISKNIMTDPKEFICTDCGATKIEDCKCPEDCEQCGA